MAEIGAIKCYCNREAVVVTSWKDGNVGRRFYGCEKYPGIGYCKFFRWIDEPLCNRAIQIIPGLLKKVNQHREETTKMEKIAENLHEITQVLESVNCKLEEENRALKEENQKLICQNMKLKMKIKEGKAKYDVKVSCDMKLLVKVSLLFCAFFGLMNVVCQLLGVGVGEGVQMKMQMKMLGFR